MPALRQRVEQHSGLLEVGGIEALGEPAVDWRQQGASLSALAVALPQPRQARGSPEFPGFGVLLARDVQGVLKTRFCSGSIQNVLL
jgi:hypothetical protein